MIFYHGTNIDQLSDGFLLADSWLTSDAYIASDFSQRNQGPNCVYVLWCEEKEVQAVYFEEQIPAWQLKVDKKPIGVLYYNDQKLTP